MRTNRKRHKTLVTSEHKSQLTGRILVNVVFRKFVIFIGYFGVTLIIFGVLTGKYPEDLAVLEQPAQLLSTSLTFIGALMTAFAIYLPVNDKPPEYFSRYISAPLVILGSFCFLTILLLGYAVSPHVINGFALMAIAGGLFRLQRKPDIE